MRPNGKLCMKKLWHQESNLHKDIFSQIKKNFSYYYFYFTFTITSNPYPRSVFFYNLFFIVLGMTLNWSGLVLWLNNQKVFRTQDPLTKIFERIFYCSINNVLIFLISCFDYY